jgi:hypothetical protein
MHVKTGVVCKSTSVKMKTVRSFDAISDILNVDSL